MPTGRQTAVAAPHDPLHFLGQVPAQISMYWENAM